ncbi:type II toxin-antitoxin system RatA family toxin [Larsenimonas rhizosphaerae]|uniref:Type II toxin-antitoxin system RatA family toxin n=1 Tax=Larsenimonas rhizosphaerae TaxID=2944682 RepID=A0AA42CV01_9GAMM|nr:type II toxin-antitoxin system RatA family toxin [Larsenimonas rhizosphaerae]MCM2131487.1 type II toxin-antitoxin system RatA family toxin [Larsenimonas rhizosphaerae]MCX2525187.1 type II toxin-antitoxin system RatA family toxin [Larsenimonas rhizosphaerae]
MPTVTQSALVKHSDRRMFDLVNDIESYPEFLPGCRAANVVDEGENYRTGRLTLAKGGVEQSFTTRNTLHAPSRIDLSLVDGPFKQLSGQWHFREMGENACRVEFSMSFEFSNRLLSMAFSRLFQQVTKQQVDAFVKRAEQVYGR